MEAEVLGMEEGRGESREWKRREQGGSDREKRRSECYPGERV